MYTLEHAGYMCSAALGGPTGFMNDPVYATLIYFFYRNG